MSELVPILSGARPPGLYRLSSRARAGILLAELAEEGWRGFHVDGRAVRDKATFLSASATAMGFPAYFGHNWDAFEECLDDLVDWAPGPGYVLLYDKIARFIAQRPVEWATARAILEHAIARWRGRGIPFYVLLRGARRSANDVPRL